MPFQNFDICVPTWNSVEYLKNLVTGIRENSVFKHQVLIHDNASTDGTADWLRHEGLCFHDYPQDRILYTRSDTNEGFCGVNHALRCAKSQYVMIFNADMYPLPGWDLEIVKQINEFKRRKIDKFTISCALIEPVGNNPEYVIANFGTNIGEFNAAELKKHYRSNRVMYSCPDTIQYSHPILVPQQLAQDIGFMDPAYFPGWASDHDLAAAAYSEGCRDFVMLGNARVYHFVSKTFSKLNEDVRRRDGQDIFFKKWRMTVDQFRAKLNIKGRYVHG